METLSLTTPQIMGIINATPDSFSGDGLLDKADVIKSAVKQAGEMLEAGANILDIGGESSRPGATPVEEAEEIQRTQPVIVAIKVKYPAAIISIDTVKPKVASAALAAGAGMINDISGFSADVEMFQLAIQYKAWLVLMHNRIAAQNIISKPKLGSIYSAPSYDNVTSEVKHDLAIMIDRAVAAGVSRAQLIIDPGLGFGKTPEQHLQLLNELDQLTSLGCPIMLGASRKGFIGFTLDVPVDQRLMGTAACVAVGIMRGAKILRVHDVAEMAQVTRMTAAIMRA